MKMKKVIPYILAGSLITSMAPSFPSKASAATWAEISVDLADRSLGKIHHGASAALYGLSEPNVPDINTLIPIKPSHILQKAPNGVQHPSGDGLRVADYFFEAGGKNIQIYMQDYYGRWYYPSRTPEEYIKEAITPITTEIKAYKDAWVKKNPGENPDDKFIYVPYNEPEQNTTRYPSIDSMDEVGAKSRATFNNDWLAIYKAIKGIDPGAKISGPNLLNYKPNVIESFIPFCIENDCLPDTISWHLLSNKSYNNAKSNLAAYRAVEAKNVLSYERKYPERKSAFPIPVDINEYASTAEIAVGGSLIQYMARYDELKITGALPYWNTANSYGSLLAGQNEPNGAWWLYKWYADMEGDMAKVHVVKANADGDDAGPGLYGLSTLDEDKKQASIVFGGTTGESHVVLKNIAGNKNSPKFLSSSDKVHITVWRAGFTGLTGFLAEPSQVADGNYDIVNGSVTLPIQTDNMESYYAVITDAVDSDQSSTWFKRYEAEHAEVRNHVLEPKSVYPRVSSGRSASNGQYIGGIDYKDSVVKFTNITVPKDGNYKLDIGEGSGSTANLPTQSGGGTSAQRQNSDFFIKIDDKPSFKVDLRADYSYEQLGMVTKYINLKAGKHSVSISKYNQDTGEMGQGAATLDFIELNYNGKMGSKPNYRVQAEFAEYDHENGLRRESKITGFKGAGYVTGYKDSNGDKGNIKKNKDGKSKNKNSGAKTRFVMGVQEDGMYDVTVRYATNNAGELSIDHDRQNVINIPVKNTKGKWQSTKVRMFLRTGINLLDIKSTAKLSLDYVNATFVNKNPLFKEEAENANVIGTPAAGDPSLIRDDAFAKNASGGKYVNGISSFDGKERYLEVPNIVVPKAGKYKLVVQYANGEYSGSHSYNNNVVERYAQVSVNGSEPKTVYFKNTISWQEFATVTMDVDLKKGKNAIKFFNDNTYNGGSNPYGGSNASGTEPFVDTVMVPKQYTPAFDKFAVYELPALLDKIDK
ncbi:hypothetical protein [Peribacillus simplex]|uniref:CBM6 domain-containing protein n=1 Tax=Peribacillus simplex NBRC 15720 = DSM 1321 TaxID=1349754 RepID=A0A223EP59_9BACI|nr:hypothetical protein [Peribacillus simplex]ASS97004.1 hypothetical protein BS1321_25755 [Peribacillus simplex NBRC 15720 = DSM 1321]MEC1398656.1 hypothetical protein [Peribacillus simplex]